MRCLLLSGRTAASVVICAAERSRAAGLCRLIRTSMKRGGAAPCAEQRAFAAQRQTSILTEDGQIWFVHYLPGHFHTEQADIDVKTNYPHENRVQLSLRGIRRELQLHLYIPQGTKDVSVQINGQPQRVQLSDFLRISVCEDAELELSFSLSPRSVPAGGFFTAKRAQMTMQGDQILSKDADRKLGFLADRIYTERDQQCRAEILDLRP